MLYEFLIGPNPFNIKQESDLANIIHVSVSLDKKDAGVRKKLDETVIDFINGCLNKDPIERLDIREIVNHEFFIKHCPELMTSMASNNPRSSNLGMGDMMK
jgi:serine/threonine protein kinase